MKNHNNSIVSIILAGGKGTRMNAKEQPKVCLDVGGRPAINLALDIYKASGIIQHIVVVGALASQVIETVGQAHEGIIFVYQAEQLGTGHAARQAVNILQQWNYAGNVFIVAGDRMVARAALQRLITEFYAHDADMAFLVGNRSPSDPGLVLLNPDGTIRANYEERDVKKRAVLRQIRAWAHKQNSKSAGGAELGNKALALMRAEFPNERKATKAFGALFFALQNDPSPTALEILQRIPISETEFYIPNEPNALTPEEVDATRVVNYSVYLLKASALYYAMTQLTTNNAQREEYLSDIITILGQARAADSHTRRFRVLPVKIDAPDLVMGFNTPAELTAVRSQFRG